MVTKVSTSRNKDGKPRRLRKVTNLRAGRRQARKMVEMKLGRKLQKSELVHHKAGGPLKNTAKNLTVVKGQKRHNTIHPGV